MNLIKKKYDFIDSYRGIAILLVLLTHVNYIFLPGSKFGLALYGSISIGGKVLPLQYLQDIVIDFGARGVQLFYLVSAFTLFNSFYIRQSKGETSIFIFFLRRIFRIAPLFYLCMITMFLNTTYHFFENFQFFTPRILSEIKNQPIEDIKYWYLTTFTFTNGFFPKYIQSPYPGGWSIAVEFSFYMLIPFLFRFIKNLKASLWLTIISLLVTTIISTTNLQSLFNFYLWSSLLNQFFFFSLGISAFFFFKDEKKYSHLNLVQFGFITVVAIGAFIRSSLPLIGVCFFLLVILTSKKNNILNNRILQYIGKISFSIYLTQWWVIIFLSKFIKINNLNWFVVFATFVLLNVALSSITYLFIEKKFIKYCEIIIKKYLIKTPVTQ